MSKKTTSKNPKLDETKFEILEKSFYSEIKDIIAQARKRIYSNIDFELVMANWKIGKMLDEKQNSLPRAEYGKKLIEELSTQMTKDFGIGYSKRNLEIMRKFFRTFLIPQTLSAQLSWSHYTVFISINNDDAREFYYKEAIERRL